MHTVNKETCKYCLECGGCDYIDVPYTFTLQEKVNNFNTLFSGVKHKPANLNSLEIIPSPMPFNYRTRCQIHVSKGRLGFYKQRSHELIEIDYCLMLDDRLNKKISELKLPTNYDGKIELYIKDGAVCERIVEKKFDNIFYQVNEGVNKLLTDEVMKLLTLGSSDNLLELYCGLGNFTFAISGKAPKSQITGIDLRVPEQKKSSKKNELIEFIEADVLIGLKKLNDQNRLESYIKLLMDPPRSGAGKKVINAMRNSKFEKIVYVSCNPDTLIDDAQTICEQGYKWQSVKLFDMFPFTKYVEAVSLFIRMPH